jgi:hypothetical protein
MNARVPDRGRFQPGDPRTIACAKKAAKASPWGRVHFSFRARKTARLEMIRAAAEGKPVQPMKLRGRP